MSIYQPFDSSGSSPAFDPSCYVRKYLAKSEKRDELFRVWDSLRAAGDAAARIAGAEEILASIRKAESDVLRKIVNEGSAA